MSHLKLTCHINGHEVRRTNLAPWSASPSEYNQWYLVIYFNDFISAKVKFMPLAYVADVAKLVTFNRLLLTTRTFCATFTFKQNKNSFIKSKCVCT